MDNRHRHISLTLTPEALNMLARLSSGEAEALINAFFTPYDLFLTYFFRYPRLISYDILHGPSKVGPAIDYVAKDPWLAGLIMLAIGGFAAINFYREYTKTKKTKDNNSHAYIYSHMKQEDDDFGAMLDAEVAGKTQNTWFNEQIERIINSDPKLRLTYKSIRIEGASVNARVDIVLLTEEEQAQERVRQNIPNRTSTPKSWLRMAFEFIHKKIFTPLWGMAGISAFAYWLLFIGASLFSHTWGTLTGLGGIEGLGNFAFGIPLALGFIYPLYKMARWIINEMYPPSKSKNLHPSEASDEEVVAAEQVASSVLRRVFTMKQFALAKFRMTREIKEKNGNPDVARIAVYDVVKMGLLDKQLTDATDGAAVAVVKTASSVISNSVSTYTLLQYIAWIVTDIISVIKKVADVVNAIPVVNTILGWAFLGISFVHGMYTAAKKLDIRNDYNDEMRELNRKITNARLNVTNLEHEHGEAVKRLNSVKAKFPAGRKTETHIAELENLIDPTKPQYFKDINRKGATKWTLLKKVGTRLLTLINGATTGIFLFRIFFVSKYAAVFLPTMLAASLSSPLTTGLVFGLGIAYGFFKLYEYHVQRKEDQARDLLATRNERIEALKEKIHTLDTAVRLLETRLLNPRGDVSLRPNNESKLSNRQSLGRLNSSMFGVTKPTASVDDQPAAAQQLVVSN